MKNTKELLTPIVAESLSIAEVIRKLGRKLNGGQQQHIKTLIQKYQLDTSHFLGQKRNQGAGHTGGYSRKTASDILVIVATSHRPKVEQLRRALAEIGRIYKCELCGISTEWNSRPLTLEVDHINRNWQDNRAENLRFLCPNCHSQE